MSCKDDWKQAFVRKKLDKKITMQIIFICILKLSIPKIF